MRLFSAQKLSAAVMIVVMTGAVRAEAAPSRAAQANEARKACVAGDVEKGIAILAELFTETRNFTYVYNQGRCYQLNGRGQEALTRFREYLRRGKGISAEDKAEVTGFIKEIEAQLAAEKKEREAEARATAEPERLTPRTIPEPPSALLVQPAGPSHGDRPESGMNQLQKIGVGLGGLAVVAAGVGVYAGLKVKSLENEVNGIASQMGTVPASDIKKQLEDGGRYETMQWMGYGLAVSALAGGAACYWLGDKRAGERAQVVAAPLANGGWVGLFGRF